MPSPAMTDCVFGSEAPGHPFRIRIIFASRDQSHVAEWVLPIRAYEQGCANADSAVTPVQQQPRFRPAARPRVAFGSVVEYLELSKVREEADKIPPAPVVTLAYFRFGNVVAALGNPRSHPCDMEFDTFETNIPDPNLHSSLRGFL